MVKSIKRDALATLIERANQPWWSPTAPHTYVFFNPESGRQAGVGLVGTHEYSTFNIWFYLAKQPPSTAMTVDNGSDYVSLFVLAKQFAQLEFDGYPLGEWAMVLSLEEFDALVRTKPPSVMFAGNRYRLVTRKTRLS